MVALYFHILRRLSNFSLPVNSFAPRLLSHNPNLILRTCTEFRFLSPSKLPFIYRNFSHGTVNLVISQGKPKFAVREFDEPKKKKWLTKKKLKMQRMREKQIRKEANRKDPRRLTLKRKRGKFANAGERLEYKIEKSRAKEALLIERLKNYEVPQAQGPVVKPHELTGEERFYFKKMAQKGSNYVPVGRRGLFGGVILNMHLHWKKHETVKVYFKPCKPGQIHEYVRELERLSGGIGIQTIGDDTAVFYRGKNYVQPEVMSPIDTLSKKRALQKSKYEQSLETVRHFIAVAEKELEFYHRHIALFSNQNNTQSFNLSAQKPADEKIERLQSACGSSDFSGLDYDSDDDDDNDDDEEEEEEDISSTDSSSEIVKLKSRNS